LGWRVLEGREIGERVLSSLESLFLFLEFYLRLQPQHSGSLAGVRRVLILTGADAERLSVRIGGTRAQNNRFRMYGLEVLGRQGMGRRDEWGIPEAAG